MIYCQEPRKTQYYHIGGGFYACSDGRVCETPPSGREATYTVEKGRMKVRTPNGKVDLAKLIVWSFTKNRPEARAIGFRDGDSTNCRLGNLIVFEEGEKRRLPESIEVVAGSGRKTTYFSVKEASYCENLSIDQIHYILRSPSESVMGQRCRNIGVVSIRRKAK